MYSYNQEKLKVTNKISLTERDNSRCSLNVHVSRSHVIVAFVEAFTNGRHQGKLTGVRSSGYASAVFSMIDLIRHRVGLVSSIVLSTV